MKRRIADGSVGSPHVRVGHRQASKPKPRSTLCFGVFYGPQQRRYTGADLRSHPGEAGVGSRQVLIPGLYVG